MPLSPTDLPDDHEEAHSKPIIRDSVSLTLKGVSSLRKAAIEIAEAGVRGADPGRGTRALLRLNGSRLHVGAEEYDLQRTRRVIIVGAGKGSPPIVRELVRVLGNHISEAFLVTKKGAGERIPGVEVLEAGHPLPDANSLVAGERLRDIALRAQEHDLVIAAFTGGTSALVNDPPEGVSLEDLRAANIALLNAGLDIGQMNTVRRHLCRLKGGHFVRLAQPANIVCLALDTAPPDLPWPDLCAPDPTTFEDALAVIDRYNLRSTMPPAIFEYLITGTQHPQRETVKSLAGMHHQLVHVGSPASACAAAEGCARELGFAAHIISTRIEGEAREVGIAMSGIANEIIESDRPFTRPCALISGGETTVTLANADTGQGGPNQEFVLGFALKMRTDAPWVCISIDTDGTDGPTEAAGGLVDSHTKERARSLGGEIGSYLQHHDSLSLLQQLGDVIWTGPTGTNVMNLRIVVIGKR